MPGCSSTRGCCSLRTTRSTTALQTAWGSSSRGGSQGGAWTMSSCLMTWSPQAGCSQHISTGGSRATTARWWSRCSRHTPPTWAPSAGASPTICWGWRPSKSSSIASFRRRPPSCSTAAPAPTQQQHGRSSSSGHNRSLSSCSTSTHRSGGQHGSCWCSRRQQPGGCSKTSGTRSQCRTCWPPSRPSRHSTLPSCSSKQQQQSRCGSSTVSPPPSGSTGWAGLCQSLSS